VGIEDDAIDRERDHGLRLADRGDFSFVVSVKAFLVCNVISELTDIERLAILMRDRVVARLNPNFAAALTNSLVLTRIEIAAPELLPERPVLGALAVGGLDEH